MPAKTNEQRAEDFTSYNPYATDANACVGQEDKDAVTLALLAVAYEVSRLRTELHFSRKGRA